MSAIHFCSNMLAQAKTTQSSSLYYYCPKRLGLIRPDNTSRSGNFSSTEHRKVSGCGPLGCTNNASGRSTGVSGGPQLAAQQGITSPDDVSNMITEALFEEMFPYRNDRRSPARGFYTYEAFLTAARRFPAFGTTGSLEARKRELAAFFGQTSHETRGGWKDADGGRYLWGYCHIRQVNPPSDYVVHSQRWPAAPGQQYYGRGPIQLTFNWNYGQAGEALGVDLLNNPDLVATDAVVSFSSAIWFWMTPQDNKPSCHDVILGNWTPNEADLKVNRLRGYGILTNIINPGECGHGADRRVASRIAFFERYCKMLGVSPGDNLDCYDQCRF